MILMLFVFLGILAWCLVFTFLDRPSVSAYDSRDAYRILLMVMLLLLIVVSFKANAWHQELIYQIKLCR